jgi:hypothetical protein
LWCCRRVGAKSSEGTRKGPQRLLHDAGELPQGWHRFPEFFRVPQTGRTTTAGQIGRFSPEQRLRGMMKNHGAPLGVDLPLRAAAGEESRDCKRPRLISDVESIIVSTADDGACPGTDAAPVSSSSESAHGVEWTESSHDGLLTMTDANKVKWYKCSACSYMNDRFYHRYFRPPLLSRCIVHACFQPQDPRFEGMIFFFAMFTILSQN